MRILYLTRSLNGGGTEKVIAPIFEVVRKLGHEIQLVVLSPKTADILPELTRYKIKPIILSPKDRNNFFHIKEFKKILRQYQPDIVWTALEQASFVAQFSCLFTGIKVVSFKHFNITYPENKLWEKAYKNLTKLWVCCDESSKEHMQKNVGISPDRLMVWNMFWTDQKPKKNWPSFENRPLQLGSLGRMDKTKNYEAVIKAIGILKEKYPDLSQRMHFTVRGEAKETERLKQMAKDLSLEKIVSLLPFTQETEKFFRSLDLYLQPSLNEAMGVAAHEAMALGIPAIVSDKGAMALDIVHLESGYILQAPTGEEIAKAIDFFLQNPQKLPVFGEKIQEFVLKKYRLEAFFEAGKAVVERSKKLLKMNIRS
ncbi:glycosyltransferase family 4 protein [Acetobacteraceae bacterium]|nr:glycosyltransferase family 4 protein [Acetobacteraceae bacterium]